MVAILLDPPSANRYSATHQYFVERYRALGAGVPLASSIPPFLLALIWLYVGRHRVDWT